MVPGPSLTIAGGSRDAEARLLAELGAALAQRGRDAGALARPLRIAVPSQSLRRHLCAALVRRCGSLLGVKVETHRSLAMQVLERAGEAPPRGAALVPVWVQHLARRDEVLRAAFGGFEDGPALIEGSVRDLFDAGFTPAHREAVEELIEAHATALGPGAAARARAVVRVAAETLAALEHQELGHHGSLLVRAREVLARDGAAALPTEALWIHGFADATGLVTDWLEALVRCFGARALVVVPRDPGGRGSEQAFTRPLVERLALAAGAPQPIAAGARDGRIELLRAPGTTAEVRAVAVRIRALLDRGVAPEAIGLVARQLEPWRGALDAQLGRLGIPFSAPGAGAGPDAGTRRGAALAVLLEQAASTPVDTWLDVDARRDATDPDLRVALHVLGAARLADVLALDLEKALDGKPSLRLPVRRGGAGAPDGDAEEGEAATEAGGRERRNERRTIGRRRLEQAQQRARAVLAELEARPAQAPFAAHRDALSRLLDDALGWTHDGAACQRAFDALDELERHVPPGLPLARGEMALLVERALAGVAEPPLGGAGAGVQVLSVTEARGRTFSHLFVLGLNRDVFPRVADDDPFVPDALRQRLRQVLPEIPVKGRSREEERHLFAELLTASPEVTLAWQQVSDEGRERPPSPFLVRLRLLHTGLPAAVTAPALFATENGAPGDPACAAAPRPALERAALDGLAGRRETSVALRALALEEVREELPDASTAPDALARFQMAVLDELDPPVGASGALRLGPYFGYVGPARGRNAMPLYATRLEDIARCGWQAFLRRDLGLEPVPDALAALPAPNALMRGLLVHRVLERIAGDVLGPGAARLEGALARGAVRVPWPEPAALDALLRDEARKVAQREGVRLPGFATALAQRVRPMLAIAQAADWRDGIDVLGVEIEGEASLLDAEGNERRIRFRADRADRAPDGSLRLTDYKTGKPVDAAAGAGTRLAKFAKGVRTGRFLQAPAYWLAARAHAERAAGRFLFLGEEVPDAARVFQVDAETPAVAQAFAESARVVLAAWDRGVLPPRLVGADGDPASPCDWCEVATACLRGESGHRARLRDWAAADAERDGVDRALLALHRIGTEEPAS